MAQSDVTFTLTPRNGDAITRTLRFQFVEPGEFATAPMVLCGVVGESVEWAGINTFYDGIFYTADDLNAANTEVELAELGSSPIGTQAGLNALAEYQTPEQILIKASNGASDFGNKFGQPLICGEFSSIK